MTTIEMTGGMTESERVLHRMKSIHNERVEAIQKDQSPMRLSDTTRLIFHLIPEEALKAPKSISASELKRAAQSIRPLTEGDGGYYDGRFNADGFLLYSGREAARCYSQLFRTGIYEGVMSEVLYQDQNQSRILGANWCEEALLRGLSGYLPFSETLGLVPPFWMFAVIAGCDGARILVNRAFQRLSAYAIDRNIVCLPETKIDTSDTNLAKQLRPMFDVLWNAAGFERSLNYDESGNRKVTSS